jgi:hypothetical protein
MYCATSYDIQVCDLEEEVLNRQAFLVLISRRCYACLQRDHLGGNFLRKQTLFLVPEKTFLSVRRGERYRLEEFVG